MPPASGMVSRYSPNGVHTIRYVARAARNLLTSTCASVTGAVISTSIVPERCSPLNEPIVSTGTARMKIILTILLTWVTTVPAGAVLAAMAYVAFRMMR